MKILLIASITEDATANYFISAFKRSGHELLVCSDIPGSTVDEISNGLINVKELLLKRSFAADIILFFEGGSMRILPDTTGIKDCLTAWYAIDTHMDFDKHVRIGRLFDLTFVAQKQYVSRLSESGVTGVQWLPLAFATELMVKDNTERNIDIAHIGSENADMHPRRSELLAVLRTAFASTCFGQASPKEMGQIYSQARLAFNRSINNDVNMRFFEAMGAGAVLLTNRIVDNGVEDLFVEDLHFASYTDTTDLIRIARKLLADPEQLQGMSEAAANCVLSQHTYQHRTDQMIDRLASAQKCVWPTHSDLFAACLSLGMTADSLQAAATAVARINGGRLQSLLGIVASVCLNILACMIKLIERITRTIHHA